MTDKKQKKQSGIFNLSNLLKVIIFFATIGSFLYGTLSYIENRRIIIEKEKLESKYQELKIEYQKLEKVCKSPPLIALTPDDDLSCNIENPENITYFLNISTEEDIKEIEKKISEMPANWRKDNGLTGRYGEKVKKLYLLSTCGRAISKIETSQMGNRYGIIQKILIEPNKGSDLGPLWIGRLAQMQAFKKDREMSIYVYFQEDQQPLELRVNLLKKPITQVFEELGISQTKK